MNSDACCSPFGLCEGMLLRLQIQPWVKSLFGRGKVGRGRYLSKVLKCIVGAGGVKGLTVD